MMEETWREEDIVIASYYDRLLSAHGVTHRALDWGSRESQYLRFSVLVEVGDLDGSRILDVGCGLADFLHYLQIRGIVVEYTGIDINARAIRLARERFPHATFHNASLDAWSPDHAYDYVFASGLFTFRKHRPVEYLNACIRRMFCYASRAVAFNTLSAWTSDKNAAEFHADPLEVSSLCRLVTPWMVMRHDYHPRDVTYYLYRHRNGQ